MELSNNEALLNYLSYLIGKLFLLIGSACYRYAEWG